MIPKTLHVTNGDSVAGRLRVTDIPGEILPWRDILHEGPVPSGLSPGQLREARARFIADQGWGAHEEVLREFETRDRTLGRWHEFDEIVLWFEHDLYDQLQLAQIFDFFAAEAPEPERLRLVSVEAYVEQELFVGLGSISSRELATLYEPSPRVTREQLELGRSAWQVFRNVDPTAITRWLDDRHEELKAALPYMAPAFKRHLEQFPWVDNGLGRTERQILADVAAGFERPIDVFTHDHEHEESPFLGDTTAFAYVKRLASGAKPLLASEANPGEKSWLVAPLRLTRAGEQVLAGTRDQIDLNGIDRWLGGVHLTSGSVWRWDPDRRTIRPGSSPP